MDKELLKRIQKIEEDLENIKKLLQKINRATGADQLEEEVDLRERLTSNPSVNKAINKISTFTPALLFSGLLITLLWQLVSPQKNGLIGEYYQGEDFNKINNVQLNKNINFKWRIFGPMKGNRREKFSVRWTGFIHIEKEGEYDFITRNDDGARLWVNNRPLINDWKRHWPRINTGTIKLSPGFYPIRIDYFQHRRGAEIRLFWKQVGEKNRKLVPSKILFPNQESIRKLAGKKHLSPTGIEPVTLP